MTRWSTGAFALVVVVAAGTGARASAAEDPAAEFVAVCPCDTTAGSAAWASHGEYVACVVAAAREHRLTGVLRPQQLRAAIRAAKRSTCGNPLLTRCCIYASDDDEVGRCRMMAPAACDALDARMETGEADDDGSGSCLPNPCAF